MSYDQNGTVTNKQTQTFPVAATAIAPMAYQQVAAQWNKPAARSSAAVAAAGYCAQKQRAFQTAPAAGAR